MKQHLMLLQGLLAGGALLFGTGCATYNSKIQKTLDDLHGGRTIEAIADLKVLAEKPGDDQLIYLLEYGTALQIAGELKDSNQVFLRADRLSEQMDYHSASNITLATLGSEEMIQYKGESYEKLMINTQLALNFLMLGQNEDALVEARRINEKVNKFRQEARENYELNPFANYLTGLLWEAESRFDDAYIAYEAAYNLDPGNPFIADDLLRLSKRARRDDAYRKWRNFFRDHRESPAWTDPNQGEVVVIVQQGWGPRKDFSLTDHRFPSLYSRVSQTKKVGVEFFDKLKNRIHESIQTSRVYDVEKMAMRTFQEDMGWRAARKIGAFAAKEVVADQIRQKDELLGFLAWLGMHASDRADLRHWATLPESVQMVRQWVPAGTYDIKMLGLDGGGQITGDEKIVQNIVVKPRQKTFLLWRPLR